MKVVSFTAALNLRSRGVMERLGMVRNTKDDFDHPMLSATDPLRLHVLYPKCLLSRLSGLPDFSDCGCGPNENCGSFSEGLPGPMKVKFISF
jgi:hypothetical protein